MRKFFLTAFVLAASLVVASTGLALEKTAMRVTDEGRGDDWAAGSLTCTVQYYNICTGWVWVLSGFPDDDARVGTTFTDCDPDNSCALDSNFMFFVSAAPAGYGFTGTASVYAADANECPTGAPLAQQSLLPVSFWNLLNWGGLPVPNSFVIEYQFASTQGLPNPLAIGADHPAAGPTGPQACGTCYPTSRVNHSYYFGNSTTTLCPGSVLFNDGICDAQLLFDAAMTCVVSVEDQSWGAVKNLYR
jgi:hypothetical protein